MEEKDIVWKDRKHIGLVPSPFTKYYIADGRLILETGILKTVIEETLLYRIVDITMEQPLFGKMFGTGTLRLKTRVDDTPEITLQNIIDPRETRNLMSKLVEESRQSQKIVGKEFYGEDYECKIHHHS